MNEYYIKVLTFLKQELPTFYHDRIYLTSDKIVVQVPDDIDFNESYQEVKAKISEGICRVRERVYDLHFNVKSRFQEREFSILK